MIRENVRQYTTLATNKIGRIMNKPDKAPYFQYYNLISQVDSICESLEKVHNQHLNCKKGCDLCCMAISVFPVEFYAIKAELDLKLIAELPVQKSKEQCRFLVDHNCSIYAFRPLICRTHGLPLVYMNLEETEYEMALCELNFIDYDMADFNEENTYPMDRINSQLYMINKEFVSGFKGGRYSDQDRIQLAELID